MALITLFREECREGAQGKRVSPEPKHVEVVETETTIQCKKCGHEITKPSLAVQPHEYKFRNPLGILYHIRCFRDAPGALDAGQPTTHFTWFPNYAWSFAHCQKCQSHLGWWFAGPDRFIGLIADRVT